MPYSKAIRIAALISLAGVLVCGFEYINLMSLHKDLYGMYQATDTSDISRFADKKELETTIQITKVLFWLFLAGGIASFLVWYYKKSAAK